MKILALILLAILSSVVASEDEARDKRQVVLVPHPVVQPQPGVPVILVPVAPPPAPLAPVAPMIPNQNNKNIPPPRYTLQCGVPAFTCQGPCDSNGVGGIAAVKGEYPWLAQLYADGRFTCGASIIDNNFILTSASCIEPTTPASVAGLRVRVGDFKLNTNEDGLYVERNVTTFYRHTDFVPQGRNPAVHDIALLRLSAPLTYTDYIRPICLDDGSNPRVDAGVIEGVLAGYGKISYSNRPQSNILNKVRARISPQKECQQYYASQGIALGDMSICAGTPTIPSVDSCVGDNGSPLIVPSKAGTNSYVQVGILSYGVSCAGTPPVFTRVSAYRPWIEAVKMQMTVG